MIVYGNAADLRSVLLVCMTFMSILMFPGISSGLWKTLNGKWITHRERRLCRRKRENQGRLKKYCVIDMRKFR